MVCSQSDLLCQIVAWLMAHSEILLLITLSLATVYAAWQDGYAKGRSAEKPQSYREGFINGIMHHIKVRAFNAADFPTQYQNDDFMLEAQQRVTQQLSPTLPTPLRPRN